MIRHPLTPRSGFTLTLLAVVGCQGLLTWPIPSSSFVLPAYILVPTTVLLGIQLVLDLRGGRSRAARGKRSATARDVAWLLLMPALLAIAGLVPGAALYTLLYLKCKAGETWGLSAVATAAVGGVLALMALSLQRPGLFVPLLW